MARRSALRRAREGKGRRAKAFAPSFAFAGGGPGATDSGAGRAGGGERTRNFAAFQTDRLCVVVGGRRAAKQLVKMHSQKFMTVWS